jgi:hypothetical protein
MSLLYECVNTMISGRFPSQTTISLYCTCQLVGCKHAVPFQPDVSFSEHDLANLLHDYTNLCVVL